MTRRPGADERSERRMRIALLAPADNVHTHKWLDFYDQQGFDVFAISLEPHRDATGFARPRVRTAYLPLRFGHKAAYLLTVQRLRKLLVQADPDIVHAHYVSSYGLLGALAGRPARTTWPYVISVWGSDIYDFPAQGPAQRRMVEFALGRADAICSTSAAMAAQTARFTDQPIAVTPFGVDTAAFAPAPRAPDGRTVFGIVKAMRDKYGIDVLLRAYREFCDRVGAAEAARTELVVVGDGPQLAEYVALAGELGIAGRTDFRGRIPHADVPAVLASFDVFVVPSVLDSESFGVAAVEAQACGLPVLAAAVGGLAEVVLDGETGYLVPPRDPVALAERMVALHADPAARARLGAAGRTHVVANFTWASNAALMLDVYAGLGFGDK